MPHLHTLTHSISVHFPQSHPIHLALAVFRSALAEKALGGRFYGATKWTLDAMEPIAQHIRDGIDDVYHPLWREFFVAQREISRRLTTNGNCRARHERNTLPDLRKCTREKRVRQMCAEMAEG